MKLPNKFLCDGGIGGQPDTAHNRNEVLANLITIVVKCF